MRNYRCSQTPDCGFGFVGFLKNIFLHLYMTGLVLREEGRRCRAVSLFMRRRKKVYLGGWGENLSVYLFSWCQAGSN